MADEETRRRFGPFRLERLLGQGGMGEVWAATRPGGPPVALKILQAQGLETMFEDEARVLGRLRHRGVVRVFGLHRDRGRLALEMEFLRGCTLHALQRRLFLAGRALPIEAGATIGARLAEALAHLHQRRVVHRDVAPQNVIVEPDGRVVLLDFGVAYADARKTRTAVGIVKGRPAFMAPEQAMGALVGPRADVYALGVLLWELWAGRPLFSRETGVADALRRPSPPPLRSVRAELPLRLSALVEAMLVPDESKRIDSNDAVSVLAGFAGPDEALAGLITVRGATAPLPTPEREQLWPAEDTVALDDEAASTRATEWGFAASAEGLADGPPGPDPSGATAISGPTRAAVAPGAAAPASTYDPEDGLDSEDALTALTGPTGPTTSPDGPLMTWSGSSSDSAGQLGPTWAARPSAQAPTYQARALREAEKPRAAKAPAGEGQRSASASRMDSRPRPPSRGAPSTSHQVAPKPLGPLAVANAALLVAVLGLMTAVLFS